MSIEYRLPKELQETHEVVSEISIAADPIIIQKWLEAMDQTSLVNVTLSSYRQEFLAYVPRKKEPNGTGAVEEG